MSNRREYEVSEVGVFAPKAREKSELIAGEVGFVVANVKVIQDAKVGDTLTDPSARRTSRSRASRRSSRWCSRDFPRRFGGL